MRELGTIALFIFAAALTLALMPFVMIGAGLEFAESIYDMTVKEAKGLLHED